MMTGKKNEIQSLQPKSKIISRIQEIEKQTGRETKRRQRPKDALIYAELFWMFVPL